MKNLMPAPGAHAPFPVRLFSCPETPSSEIVLEEREGAVTGVLRKITGNRMAEWEIEITRTFDGLEAAERKETLPPMDRKTATDAFLSLLARAGWDGSERIPACLSSREKLRQEFNRWRLLKRQGDLLAQSTEGTSA